MPSAASIVAVSANDNRLNERDSWLIFAIQVQYDNRFLSHPTITSEGIGIPNDVRARIVGYQATAKSDFPSPYSLMLESSGHPSLDLSSIAWRRLAGCLVRSLGLQDLSKNASRSTLQLSRQSRIPTIQKTKQGNHRNDF